MITNATGSFLLATNFNSGQIDVFDSNFNLVTLAGSFTDPTLPAGYAPFGIQPIGSQVFVTYALQNAAKNKATAGAGNGYVSVFDVNGNFVSRFASTGTLNAPWESCRPRRTSVRSATTYSSATSATAPLTPSTPTETSSANSRIRPAR